ncbi:hypothetical protein KCV07_g17, partial [Aureobasidium melanogenum]
MERDVKAQGVVASPRSQRRDDWSTLQSGCMIAQSRYLIFDELDFENFTIDAHNPLCRRIKSLAYGVCDVR